MNRLRHYWETEAKPSLLDLYWLFRMALVIVGVIAVAAWFWFAVLTAISDYMGRYIGLMQ